MAKEVKMYEAKDGELFKTKQGAINHDKKIAVNSVLTNLDLTEDEIAEKLRHVSKRYVAIKKLLEIEPDWTKWVVHHILSINAELFEMPQKKTIYVMEYKVWGELREQELFIEEGAKFPSEELHCEDEYKVVRTEDVNDFTRKVYYDYKYSWEDRMLRKLNNEEKLSESEISDLIMNFDVVYEEEGEDRRWSRSMLSVVDIKDNLFAIEWEHGLTENQDNQYFNQPYPVKLKTEEKIVKTTVTSVIKREIAKDEN